MKTLVTWAFSIVLMGLIVVAWRLEGLQAAVIGICSQMACTVWVKSWWPANEEQKKETA